MKVEKLGWKAEGGGGKDKGGRRRAEGGAPCTMDYALSTIDYPLPAAFSAIPPPPSPLRPPPRSPPLSLRRGSETRGGAGFDRHPHHRPGGPGDAHSGRQIGNGRNQHPTAPGPAACAGRARSKSEGC